MRLASEMVHRREMRTKPLPSWHMHHAQMRERQLDSAWGAKSKGGIFAARAREALAAP